MLNKFPFLLWALGGRSEGGLVRVDMTQLPFWLIKKDYMLSMHVTHWQAAHAVKCFWYFRWINWGSMIRYTDIEQARVSLELEAVLSVFSLLSFLNVWTWWATCFSKSSAPRPMLALSGPEFKPTGRKAIVSSVGTQNTSTDTRVNEAEIVKRLLVAMKAEENCMKNFKARDWLCDLQDNQKKTFMQKKHNKLIKMQKLRRVASLEPARQGDVTPFVCIISHSLFVDWINWNWTEHSVQKVHGTV